MKSIVSVFAVVGLAVGLLAPAIVSATTYNGPNGKIAWSSPTGVKVANADGSGVVTIPGTDALSGQPRLSPDSKRLLYTNYDAISPTSPSTIFVANADGTGTATAVTTNNDRRNDGGTWSPDGKWIAYAQDFNLTNSNYGGHINIVSSTGGSSSLLINAVTCDGGSGGTSADGWEEPSWSPDGKRIAVMHRCTSVNGGIYTFGITNYTAGSGTQPGFDLAASNQISGHDGAVTASSFDYWPSFSPDSSKVLFVRSGATKQIMTGPDSNDAATTSIYSSSDSIIQAVMSPDGSKILFDQGPDLTNRNLYTIAATGGTATVVPNSSGATSADWGSTVNAGENGGGSNGGGQGNTGAAGGAQGSAGAAAPGTPNTGFALVSANPAASFAITSMIAVALLVIARRFKFATARR